MILKMIDRGFSICKVKGLSNIDLNREFTFVSRTDEECSLVCPTEHVPSDTIERNDGWKAFRIQGTLGLSLIGILSGISGILAENGIGIFAISTFDTDYILTKEESFQRAMDVLTENGYSVVD